MTRTMLSATDSAHDRAVRHQPTARSRHRADPRPFRVTAPLSPEGSAASSRPSAVGETNTGLRGSRPPTSNKRPGIWERSVYILNLFSNSFSCADAKHYDVSVVKSAPASRAGIDMESHFGESASQAPIHEHLPNLVRYAIAGAFAYTRRRPYLRQG